MIEFFVLVDILTLLALNVVIYRQRKEINQLREAKDEIFLKWHNQNVRLQRTQSAIAAIVKEWDLDK